MNGHPWSAKEFVFLVKGRLCSKSRRSTSKRGHSKLLLWVPDFHLSNTHGERSAAMKSSLRLEPQENRDVCSRWPWMPFHGSAAFIVVQFCRSLIRSFPNIGNQLYISCVIGTAGELAEESTFREQSLFVA